MNSTATAELSSRLRAFRSRYGIPGVGAAVLTVHHPPVIAVTGVRVRGRPEPVTPADRWHIGSCAKSVTATLFARLVQRGATDWEATLDDLFDDLGPGRHPGWRGITISDVLTHRAGIAANPTAADLRAAQSDPTPLPIQRTALARRTLATPPVRPGEFCYSNLGYTIAGAAIERITGRPFEAALRDEILQPLGMTSAGFGAPTGQQPWGHRPRLRHAGRGPALDPEHTASRQPPDNPPVLTPAGRLHVALHDWAVFIRLFLTPTADFLALSSVAAITTAAPGSRQGMGWAVHDGLLAQQGSNLRWVATAIIAEDRRRGCLVVCNDGRTRLLPVSWALANDLRQESLL